MPVQRLYKLNRTSTRFPERLERLLHDKKWVERLQRLPEGQLVELIGYLDSVRFVSMPTISRSSRLQILDGLDRAGSPFREGLHVLQEICGSRAVLPATYDMPDKLSLNTNWVASDGSSAIYKGSLGGADVRIKRLRTYTTQVPHFRDIWLDIHTLTSFGGILQGGCGVEIFESPEYCTI